MKTFYIETSDLTLYQKTLRLTYSEYEDGSVILNKLTDPNTNEEVYFQDLKRNANPDFLLNIQTAYRANYKRTYL